MKTYMKIKLIKNTCKIVSVLCFTALTLKAFGLENHRVLAKPATPPKLAIVKQGSVLEADITLIESGPERQVYIYQVGGITYATKIIPAYGPAYYLIDSEGDGNFVRTGLDTGHALILPQWVLYKW